MNVKGMWWSYSYFNRTNINEGCSDTRLATEPVPRVSGDLWMMPLVHHISTMGKDLAMPASTHHWETIDIVPPRVDWINFR